MSTALDNGLEVTALHNHFFWDSPKIMFMHIGGMGEETKPAADIDPALGQIDPKPIDAIMGTPGDMTRGVYKVTIGRKTSMMGHEMGSAMGVNTWAAFAGSDSRAVVDGDFAMHDDRAGAGRPRCSRANGSRGQRRVGAHRAKARPVQ